MIQDILKSDAVDVWHTVSLFFFSSPEGSYTDDPNQEHRAPPQPDQHEFDDEFEDDDPLPAIGHCKALYSFDGTRFEVWTDKPP